ncbi:hypothetical protein WN943_025003 [Citrus x changshan-huyou]
MLSLVSLINDVLEEVYKRHKYDNENFQLIAIIPWSCERQHLKIDLEYINLVNLILEKGFDFLKLEMDVVAMDTLSPVKRRLFNEQIRIFEAYESGYKHTEVQPQQTKQVYSESDSEPEVVCFANLGDSDGDDGLSDCESIEKEKNDKSRLTAVCADKCCEWRIHASVLVDKVSVEIRTLKGGDHKCKPVFKNLEVTSNWIAQKLYSSIINNPGIGSGAMSTELRKRFNTSTTKKRLYRAKKQVLHIADNDFAKSYARLHDYGNIILTKNKGATVKIQQELQGTQAIFKRIFVSYDALRNGFMQGCRRFIGVDGCHLKTSFGGVLLSAVSLDANNGIFPLAFCICEVECKDSWLWFLGLLKEHMNIQNEMALTIMSDRQKGLIQAIQVVFPRSTMRHCARHIYANFRKVYSA